MRVLINALSVTNQSGRHVLLGHLSRLAAWSGRQHCYTVLYHAGNADLVRDLGPNVTWQACPARTAGWFLRAGWERLFLPALARRERAGCVFSPAGVAVPGLGCRQVVLCQNPWSLVPALRRGPGGEAKAFLQRRAYRAAMRLADVMVFNSHYMHEAYRRNAGFDCRRPVVAYQGINEGTFADAGRLGNQVARDALRILSVSAMARHKDVETLLRALVLVRQRFAVPARLDLVGAWPDPAYRTEMESLCHALGLDDAVSFRGHVSAEELHRCYAAAQVFCLMSRCESFGIPAVEAQCFGTPVVSSNCCAIPEVCGEGGVYPDPGDPLRTAEGLTRLLSDGSYWQRLSRLASANTQRFRWDVCSRPLFDAFCSLSEEACGQPA